MVQGTKDSNTYNELNRRACDAERLRDEANIKMEQMEAQLRRSEMKYEMSSDKIMPTFN